MSTEMLLAKEKLIKAIRTCLKNNNQPPEEKSIAVLLAEESILTVMQTLEEKQIDTESMQELLLQFSKDLRIALHIMFDISGPIGSQIIPPDTAYPPVGYDVSNLLPRQHIDFCSLNNVSCSSKQYGVFCKLNTMEPFDEGITMEEPNDYIFVTRKNFLSGAASEWFKKDCIGSITTWEDLVEKFVQKFYQLSNNNEEMEADEDDNPDDIADIFKIEGNLFNFETPLCKEFNEFNYLLKIDTDLFAFDIAEIKTYEEYELNNKMTNDLEEPWLDKGVSYQLYHKWYDELTDGKLKEEALMHKARFEES
ncbi:hypothetical protein Tco_0053495 [Tanacetum coccineum]